MNRKTSILLIEDEENFGMVLKNYLELNKYSVTWCENGKEGLTSFKNGSFDLCICDIMMPEVDGYQVAKEVRKINTEIPFIFLSAKNQKQDLIEGYKLGADDYITKPFDTEVLLLKIKAILSRTKEINHNREEFQIGIFSFNKSTRELKSKTNKKRLSPKESALLTLLCENENHVVSRDLALNKIWNDDSYFAARSMDVFITKIRKYLKEDSRIEIINVHGNGFRLIVD